MIIFFCFLFFFHNVKNSFSYSELIISVTKFKNDFAFLQISSTKTFPREEILIICPESSFYVNIPQPFVEEHGIKYYRFPICSKVYFKLKKKCITKVFGKTFPIKTIYLKSPYLEIGNLLNSTINIKNLIEYSVEPISNTSKIEESNLVSKPSKKEIFFKNYNKKMFFLNRNLREFNVKHLENRKVILSLTTSPKRIFKLYLVLESLNLDLVSHIFLCIPKRYRNTLEYKIPTHLLKKYSKLKILLTNFDVGSITKIFPTVLHARNINPNIYKNDIFITVDDDYIYTENTIDSLIYNILKKDSAFVLNVDGISNHSIYGEGLLKDSYYNLKGYSGAVYYGKHFSLDLMKKFIEFMLTNNITSCMQSDDFVISYFLRKNKVSIGKIKNFGDKFYKDSQLKHLDHFLDNTALHRTTLSGKRSNKSSHYPKYENCYTYILRFFNL